MSSSLTTDYQPGACNIGPAEVRRRWLGAHFGAAVTAALFLLLVLLDAPPVTRLLIALPASGTAISYLQAMLRFCVAFGMRGVFNFGEVGHAEQVGEASAQAADRRRARAMIVTGLVLGLAIGVVTALLPS